MELILSVVCGCLFAASFYLLLRRNLLRFIIGLIVLGNAVNLLIFTMGRLTRSQPPVIPYDMEVPPEPYANPLPQALILTAIVISFGLLAFTLVLVYRNYTVSRTVDADRLDAAEHPDETPDLHTDTKRLPA
jgi:multicomponent Na+:H+ antiporter subunit C